jgi:hypothetical protein
MIGIRFDGFIATGLYPTIKKKSVSAQLEIFGISEFVIFETF